MGLFRLGMPRPGRSERTIAIAYLTAPARLPRTCLYPHCRRHGIPAFRSADERSGLLGSLSLKSDHQSMRKNHATTSVQDVGDLFLSGGFALKELLSVYRELVIRTTNPIETACKLNPSFNLFYTITLLFLTSPLCRLPIRQGQKSIITKYRLLEWNFCTTTLFT